MNNLINFDNIKWVDLTHSLSSEIPQWNSNCGFQKFISLNYEECDAEVKFQVNRLEMVSGIGTHIDAPSHCIKNAKTIDQISLNQLIANCYVINVSNKADENYRASVNDIYDFESRYEKIRAGSIVLFYTGWSKFWEDVIKYRNNLQFPSISKEAAELLLERNVAGLGIDTLSPDCANTGFPVHQILLKNDKIIIENVANAWFLPPVGAVLFALPIKIKDGTEAPLRLIAMINN
jgi:kynurenine formamidase